MWTLVSCLCLPCTKCKEMCGGVALFDSHFFHMLEWIYTAFAASDTLNLSGSQKRDGNQHLFHKTAECAMHNWYFFASVRPHFLSLPRLSIFSFISPLLCLTWWRTIYKALVGGESRREKLLIWLITISIHVGGAGIFTIAACLLWILALFLPSQSFMLFFVSTCSVWPDSENTIYRAYEGWESGYLSCCRAPERGEESAKGFH